MKIQGFKPSEKMPNLYGGDTESAAWEESKPCLVLTSWGSTVIARCEVWCDDEQVSEWYLIGCDHQHLKHENVIEWAYLPEWV